jgi:hypothetical protein
MVSKADKEAVCFRLRWWKHFEIHNSLARVPKFSACISSYQSNYLGIFHEELTGKVGWLHEGAKVVFKYP